VPKGLFRIRDEDGSFRLAVGDPRQGPRHLLAPDVTLDSVLAGTGPTLEAAIASADGGSGSAGRVVAPVESQEIWAAGVTYLRSREARVEEAVEPSPYDRVYEAERPELFLKAPGWRAVGPDAQIGVRVDSEWNVPEPELALVLDASLAIVGYTIGNDVSSRTIEGENTLYLPQAKTYDRSCAVGPSIVPASAIEPPFEIRLTIDRDGRTIHDDSTTTASMARTFEHLTSYLGRALTLPVGAVLLTGTGIVPDPPFTLRPGDDVRIAIEGLGVLRNRVTQVGSG
jgi:2-dehydro-3-deoxy-D-arabinonate dehydratase